VDLNERDQLYCIWRLERFQELSRHASDRCNHRC
jgi:hypothetical protein